jgi:RHH-type proline utilization regulon transcriptional repressor/proline dehydrogenase/delta 1-pyrroline-5-carboxylate dehydrogenase
MTAVASKIAKTPFTFSIDRDNTHLSTLKTLFGDAAILLQNENEFISGMDKFERIRTCSQNVSIEVYKKAARLGLYIAMQEPLVEGRLELLHYLKEQSVAFEYHRYGSFTEVPVI